MKRFNLLILMSVLFGCVTINTQELKKAAGLIGYKIVNEQTFDLNTTDAAEFDKWKKDIQGAESN